MAITIPYKFTPRDYQIPLFEKIEEGIKRAFCIWHRRSGKDKALFNLLVREAMKKVGAYYYFFPTYKMGKKVLWDGIDNDGFKFLDHVPDRIIEAKNSTELKIKLINGSIIQIIGTDKYDSVRGTNPMGCVFSEFAFQNPMAWEVVRPILAANGGWAAFNTTPNGKNHAYELLNNVKDDPSWFVDILKVTDTNVVSEEVIEEDRKSGMSEEMIQQEYYCSFDIGAVGSYYAKEINEAREQGRISRLPYYKDRDVDIFFDLGINDMMAMWFMQRDGQNINLINVYENNNQGLEFYFRYIDEYFEQKGGKLGNIYVPHDAKKRELATGKTVVQIFHNKYGNKVKMIPLTGLHLGINSVRAILPRCWFDPETCKAGLLALENYKRDWDDVGKVFRNHPKHDWTSHLADAFRYLAVSQKDVEVKELDIKQKLGIIEPIKQGNPFCNF